MDLQSQLLRATNRVLQPVSPVIAAIFADTAPAMHHSGNIQYPEFADDLAWLCGELGVERAVLGWTQYGCLIAMQLAATHPELSAAVCLIDSVVFPSDAFIAQLELLGDQLAGAAYIQTLHSQQVLSSLQTDDPVRKAHVYSRDG